MRSITTTYLSAAILVAALALPVVAWAASDTAPAVTPPTTSAAAEPAAVGQRERVEQRIADMHATLHITASQEAQWDSFSQVMLDNAQAMDTAIGKNASTTTPRTAKEIMDTYARIAELHAQNVQKLSNAFDTLYAGLTADQKKAADEMFAMKALEHQQKRGG
ncbi:MAG TPA: Spy/CpxP family protein refolding chaperone [Rhodanobacter sp.]|nr:Spy/CpxP family protein refolding chaperone [Rhodanobacter sp.]